MVYDNAAAAMSGLVKHGACFAPGQQGKYVAVTVPGNPLQATAEKGEEALRRYADHTARGILELVKVPVEVHNREFVNRV